MGKFDKLKAQIEVEKKPDKVLKVFPEVDDKPPFTEMEVSVYRDTDTVAGPTPSKAEDKPKEVKKYRGVQFRALETDITRWGIYAKLAGFKRMQDFYSVAVNEYMERHPVGDIGRMI